MKYILLLRHAKSLHNSGLNDYDRPLAPRGERDAPAMGAFLRGIGITPDVVVSSPAKRAKQTTKLFLSGAGIDESVVRWNDDLYYGSSQDYMDAIKNNTSGGSCVLLVGHNPKIEDAARRLCGSGSVRMPTAALACFEQPANEWSQISEGLASLKWLMIPKLLAKMG